MSTSIPVSNGRVAVLVDGENISREFAAEILKQARQLGVPQVRRVYGNAINGWEGQAGFKFVHTYSGKNSADMKLAIDAMELACTGSINRFVLATSDGDFTHLAFALVERGLKVLGVGEYKAPEVFREACSEFVQVGSAKPPVKAVSKEDILTRQVIETIERFGDKGGLKIEDLNALMRHKHCVLISKLPESNWRNFLTGKPHLFTCEPKGPKARVCVKEAVSTL